MIFGLAISLSLSAAESASQSRSGYPVSLNDGYGKALIFTGDFDGAHRTEVLSYYTETREWFLRDFNGTHMARVPVGNTSGFGNLADGRPLWAGNFAGTGQSEVLFYYPGDRNWWLGSVANGQLAWKLVDNTTGFGNVWDGRPFYVGNFSRTDRSQLLFYYPGDSNWWLGTYDGATIGWTLAGNTLGFGNLTHGQPFLIDDFNSDQKTDVMFYSPGDHNWWLANFQGTQMRWSFVGNTAGFGNLADGRPIWSGDFEGQGRAGAMFYYPGDGNWWFSSLNGGQLAWSLVSNTKGFGNLADGRPIYVSNFSKTNQTDVLFFHPADNNWWLGSAADGQLQWSLSGNTAGFGSGFAGQVKSNVITGAFTGGLAQVLYFSAFNQTLWLGSFNGASLGWKLVDELAPNAPSNLGVGAVNQNSVSIHWTNNGPAADTDIKILVERKTGPSGTYQEIASFPSSTSSMTDYNVSLGTTYFYRVRAANVLYESDYSNEVSATPHYLPPSIQFQANPSTINAGQSSTLSFSVVGASSVQIDHGIGSISASGSKVVAPATTTTYTLTATGPGGTATAQATVTVITVGVISVSMGFGAVTSTPYQCTGHGTVTIKPNDPAAPSQTQQFSYSGFSSTIAPPACQTTVTFTNLRPGTWSVTDGHATCTAAVTAGQFVTVKIWNEVCQ
jgi:hypothetical protein